MHIYLLTYSLIHSLNHMFVDISGFSSQSNNNNNNNNNHHHHHNVLAMALLNRSSAAPYKVCLIEIIGA